MAPTASVLERDASQADLTLNGFTVNRPEWAAGMAQLHALVGYCPGQDDEDAEVLIETDRGPWVAAGYLVFAVNPLQAARFRERHQVPGPRATPGTHTCWRRWCAPMHTGCGRRPGTARPRGDQGPGPRTRR